MRKNIPKSYEYIENISAAETVLMKKARENSEKIGLGAISISSAEAQIIKFHLADIQPRKVVEIGTLTGLSALHILESIPEKSLLITIEKSEQHAILSLEVLREAIEKKRCRLITGDAREILVELKAEGPFDAVFIDGNKAAYLDYFNWAVENVRPQGLIFVDNVFLAGAIWGDETKQRFNVKQIDAVKQMNLKAFSDKNLRAVIIPTEEGLLIVKKVN